MTTSHYFSKSWDQNRSVAKKKVKPISIHTPLWLHTLVPDCCTSELWVIDYRLYSHKAPLP